MRFAAQLPGRCGWNRTITFCRLFQTWMVGKLCENFGVNLVNMVDFSQLGWFRCVFQLVWFGNPYCWDCWGQKHVKTCKNHLNQLDHDLTWWRNSGMMGGWIRGTTPKWLNIPAMFRFSDLKCEREQRCLIMGTSLSFWLSEKGAWSSRPRLHVWERNKYLSRREQHGEKAAYTAFTL